MSYVRIKGPGAIIFQHNHTLEVKDKQLLLTDPLLVKELDMFVKCGLSCANIYNIVKKKYQIKLRYTDVY